MRRHLAFAVLIGTLAAGGFAAIAAAGPPDHFTDSVDYSGFSPCGSFNDMYQGHLDISGITKFDQAGNPVEDVIHFSGWERNWRSDRPSVSIVAKREFNVTFDYATSVEKDTGIVFSQTASGQGVLFHDAGSIVFDDAAQQVIAVHGPHDVFANGNAVFCTALVAVS